MTSPKEEIRSFLSQHVRDTEFKDDDDLFSKGFVSSLFAMELVLFVEKQFGLAVDNADLDPDNFRSVNAIATLIARKTGTDGSV